ncbi:SDR family NAD(P)-dependent oxidoreductase [Pseudoclavibacter sp. VKM Ac-2867]|uniref:SDR family NAD(P)-dependent oxidoreductase n=1 Tax=Pseudoclavibacter sp. VKM Ac-2867 TaxID=2783829 RepID=UPI00188D2405|nr:SDR family oxidoreductase [Pseudoclavibacter sp. VKM Ac-2867]MBF4460289.1 SDR family oxidoreductase [Pseudoclavibacter sp. VKM Ac-2867]
MGRLGNKIAIITGAAGGQGKVEARLFAQQGARVIATDLNEALLTTAVAEINAELGVDAVIGIKHNIARESDWVDVVAKAHELFGRIDILINNAAIPGKTRDEVWDIDTEETSRILNVNILGSMLGIKAVMPGMKANGRGSIVNISSAAGLVGGISGGSVAYSATKGALRAITKEVALGVARFGVRVNTVYPGLIKTPIMKAFSQEVTDAVLAKIPAGFAADPIEIAYGVLYLASDESRFVTGTDLIIDGGYTAQ